MQNDWILLLSIIPIVFIAGCIGQPPSGQYIPSVSFQMSTNSISVVNSHTSDIVTITVTKNDDKQIPTSFTVNLVPSNSTYIYPISVSGLSQQLVQASTKALIDKGSSDTVQFKVFGQLPTGSTSATFTITAQLYYNNSLLPSTSPLILNVQVTSS